MNIQAIVGAVHLIPLEMRDAFFDVLERFVQDEETSILDKIGMAIIKGARIATGTKDLPDTDEAFTAVVEQVLVEASQDSTHILQHKEDIVHILDGIVKSPSNPVTILDIPEALIK